MYFAIHTGIKKAYLQWFPFSNLSETDQDDISSVEFYKKYIENGTFVLFPAALHQSENYIQKGDGSFRDASLISPILFLVLQSIGKEISEKYIAQRSSDIEVYYAGNYPCMRPRYKQDYDMFFKSVNADIEGYQYFIKTDISNFFPSISLDKLISRMDQVCNSDRVQIPQNRLSLYKMILQYCGNGRFPLIENSVCTSYLATVVYLDEIDERMYQFMQDKVPAIDGFHMVRYVDDMYILISTDKPIGYLHEAYNTIRNEYSSILKDYGLALNTKKCCIRPTHEINDELKKSLYDEFYNGEKRDIEMLFSGSLLKFINEMSIEMIFDCLSVEKYNELIEKCFSSPDIEFTPSEVFNYFVYENETELQKEDVIHAITNLVAQDLSFISLDPKRLTAMIMKTHNDVTIRAFLNQLFLRYRTEKWNSYDTSIAITYLIQSKFRHIDLLHILEKKCPGLYYFYYFYCRGNMRLSWQHGTNEKLIKIIGNDKKCCFLYFMFWVENQRNNNLAKYAYYKNYFDRVTAHLAYHINYEKNLKRPNYNRFYKEAELLKFYRELDGSDDIIKNAHKLRNENPISHASADLIDRDNTSKDLDEAIEQLQELIVAFVNRFC